MADCYYHGQSGSGPCPECESLKRDYPGVDIMEAERLRKEKELKENGGKPYRNAWGNIC